MKVKDEEVLFDAKRDGGSVSGKALLKALREDYSRDYQELIKEYFEALSQELEKQNESK